MKKLFYAITLALLILLGTSSCTGEAFDVDSVNKQTILVFLPWSGSDTDEGLTYYLSNNIDSICQGIADKRGLNNSRVLVFFSNNPTHSTLYDLSYDTSTKSVSRLPIKTYEGTSYTTAEGIADIINEAKAQAEALNYAIIIGGHGCGWTYADDWQDYPNEAKPNMSNATTGAASMPNNFSGISFGTDPNLPLTRFFGSVTQQEYAINVSTLAEGIRLSGTKMQYILLDACYMGNVETAYELKDVTNYLISSSSEILAAGIPYRSLWPYLNSSTPNYSSIVSNTVNFYKSQPKPYCNLAAIDCRQMDNLANIMKTINSKCSLSSEVPLDSIQPLDGFAPNLFFDLSVYVDSLYPNPVLKDQFADQLKKTVKATAHTDKAMSELGVNPKYAIFDVKNYCGLSISDPSLHPAATKGREKSGWWKATH